MAKFTMPQLEMILAATLTGMTVDEFNGEAKKWLASGQASALEAALYGAHLPADAGSDEAVCAPTATRPTSSPAAARTSCAMYSEQAYGIPARAGRRQRGRNAASVTTRDGKPILTKVAKLLLNDDSAGKPEGIHLMIGRRPVRRVRQLRSATNRCSEYTQAGDGARLMMLVHARRRQARVRLRSAQGSNKVGTFTAGADGRGEEERLDRDQHEERLETYLRVRAVKIGEDRVSSVEGMQCRGRGKRHVE